jgi:hypothetical protein
MLGNSLYFTIIDIEGVRLFDFMMYDIRSDHKISKQDGSYN